MKTFRMHQARWILPLCCFILVVAACTPAGSIRASDPPVSGVTPLTSSDASIQVYALAWSPDGNRLATGGKNGEVEVWTPPMTTPLITCRNSSGAIYALAWSPDGTRLAFAGIDKTVQVCDAVTGKVVFTYHSAWSTGEVLALAWSPDSQLSPLGAIMESCRSGRRPAGSSGWHMVTMILKGK